MVKDIELAARDINRVVGEFIAHIPSLLSHVPWPDIPQLLGHIHGDER